MVSTQDQLIQRAIAKATAAEGQTYKIDSKRLGILDDTGLERAKQFLEEQKKYLSTCKTQFVALV